MTKVTLDSGRSVEVQDEATAALLSDAFERLTKKVTDAEAQAEKAQATADKAAEQLEEARKASSDEAIQARVQLISSTQAQARKVAGDSFTCDSLNPIEIKRAALSVARPKVQWAEKNPVYIEAAFDAEMEKEDDEDEDDKKEGKKPTGDAATLIAQLAQLAKDGASTTTTTDAPELSPYQQYKKRLTESSKGA